MRHFEESVLAGEWEEVEKYLSGFTKLDDNRYSMKIFFEIRKQKYLEALDRNDKPKAVDILVKDLKVFASFNEDLFKEITLLLTLDNFRENEQLSKYGDTKSARTVMLGELKKLIEANPLFRDKLQFPQLKASRLRTLINQSLNWQHQLCKNPRPNPDIKTLFYDHSCSSQPNGARAPSPAPTMMNVMQKPAGFPPLGHHVPYQPAAATLPAPIAGWMGNPSSMPPHPAVSGGPLGGLAAPSNPAALLKRPMTPPSGNQLDYHSADSEHVLKRPRPIGVSPEIGMSTSHLPIGYTNIARSQHPSDELPKAVVMTLNQGSSVTSMDFHPVQSTLLLVGTSSADISVWELTSRERIAHRHFRVWELGRSQSLQAVFTKDTTITVNRVVWNSDGSLFAVAYSKHLVHLFGYSGRGDLLNHLQIDAHVGGVNDVAFSLPNDQQCLVTCGDDKNIKVWDVTSGMIRYTFDGHEAPVYSVCPHVKENIPFIFSTSVDGKIKAWLYDHAGSRVDYTAPGNCCTTMAYSADGGRLFSCGTSKDGISSLVEWHESEGAIKRTYEGLRKQSVGIPQFDTLKNRYLAAGDEFMIKFWDMDKNIILTSADAEGGLPALPRIRFNKTGSLLAVSTSSNGIKILANSDGQMLISIEGQSFMGRPATDSISKALTISPLETVSAMAGTSVSIVDRNTAASIVGMNGDVKNLGEVKPRIADETLEKQKIWKLTEINEPSQCRSLRLPDSLMTAKVPRLIYTNSGHAILALGSNAVHKLWKWPKTDRNASGKATASIQPQLWQPSNSILMTNETSDGNTDDTVHCFALSKNDSYVMSASGGKISLFNMMTFKTMTTFMAPPPAATFLAFHPQDNNIIAIGMDDSTIQIYNVRIDEVKTKLKGHNKKITGLAFSSTLNLLISSGADAQLFAWGLDAWEIKGNVSLQIPSGVVSGALAETKVQFHQDQMHLLVVHETQLAIYDAAKFECLKQWVPRDGSVTHATYSCDSQTIYASLADGSVNVFTSTLRLRCRISPTAYLNTQPSLAVHPLVIAAHPSEPNQFALGLTDGGVQVLEPLESEGKWGVVPPPENAIAVTATSSQAGAGAGAAQEQSSR